MRRSVQMAFLVAAFCGCSAAPPPHRVAPEPVRRQPPAPTATPVTQPAASVAPASTLAADPPRVEPRFDQPLVAPDRTRAVVLLYHAFDVGRDPMSVSSATLDRQLAWLHDSSVEIVGLQELVEFLEGQRRLPQRVALISIDDGLLSTYTRAFPVFQRHRARFVVGLSTRLIEEPKGFPLMSWAQVREMVGTGLCEVASHGHGHRRLIGLPDDRAREELVLSREIIERETGRRPMAYFYPLGAVDRAAAERVRAAGYRAGFTATGSPIALGSSPQHRLPRTSIVYSDDVGRFSWYFSEAFLKRLPVGFRPAPRVSSLGTTR